MRLAQITLIEQSDLADQWRHPNEMNVNNSHLDSLNEIYEEQGRIDNGDVTAIFGGAVLPSVEQIERVDIKGGWGGSRYRAIVEIVVEEPSDVRSGQRMVLVGYTDRIDVVRGVVADDTEIYINSVITVRDDEVVDRSTGMVRIISKVLSNTQLINGNYDPIGGGSDYVSRPQDIFSMLSQRQDLGMDMDDVDDSRIMFSGGAKQSRRTNNIGSTYIAKLVEYDREGTLDAMTYGNDGGAFNSTRNNRAITIARDPLVSGNTVLHTLFNGRGSIRARSFEYADLEVFTEHESLDEVDDVTEILERENDSFDFHGEELSSAYQETLIAVIISNTVPAILSELALASVKFNCDNSDTANGEMRFEMVDSTSYVSGLEDNSDLENAFINRFKTEVYDHVSRHGAEVIGLVIDSVVAGVTHIEVNIGTRDNWMNYVVPSFADSNLSPVITKELRSIQELADSYTLIRSAVDDIERDSTLNYGRSSTSDLSAHKSYRHPSRDSNLNELLDMGDDDFIL